jgi:PAS domain S-box-containing protein
VRPEHTAEQGGVRRPANWLVLCCKRPSAFRGRKTIDTTTDNARRFEAIVESSDDAIISKTLEGIITSWNPAAERLFGYKAEEIIGRSISVLMPIERHDDMESILGRIRLGERVDHYETIRVSKEGRKIEVSLSVSPVKDATGRIVGAAKIARDISGRKAAEAERERLLREAQQGVQLRDVFLSVAGHEFRTPLNALRLQLFNLAQAMGTDSGRTILAKAQSEVDRLASLTNRLLDVARMAAGGFTLEPEVMDLTILAAEVVGRMQQDAANAGVRIRLSAPEPVSGYWDGDSLDQVLTNLLSNALKFGRGKPVDVEVACKGGLARLIVRDQGPGVAPEDRERIFGRFERGVSDRSYGGLGLGLWIAQQIVTAHGGRIGVADVTGEGAAFFVELPQSGEGGQFARPAGG